MLIRNFMTKNVITIDDQESMPKAIQMLKQHKINMLPVTRQGNLVGVITDRDLKQASPSQATDLDVHELKYLLTKIKIKDIMTKNVITVPPDLTIEETAEVLMQKDISGAPVVDEHGVMVGIITSADLFRALIALSGLGRKGVQFAFQIEDRPGTIKELTDIIRAAGGRIASIMSSVDRVRDGWRNVYIRAYEINRQTLPQLIQDLQNKATMLFMVDHKENKRQIFPGPAPVGFKL